MDEKKPSPVWRLVLRLFLTFVGLLLFYVAAYGPLGYYGAFQSTAVGGNLSIAPRIDYAYGPLRYWVKGTVFEKPLSDYYWWCERRAWARTEELWPSKAFFDNTPPPGPQEAP